MPMDATTTLTDVSALVQEAYYNEYLPQYERFGTVTRKLLKLAPEPVSGDGKTFQDEWKMYDTFRPNRDVISDFATPGQFTPQNLKVRWNENDSASNDFCKLSGSGQVTEYEATGATDAGTIVKIANRIASQMSADYNMKWSTFQNCGRSAQLALVDGSPKNNNQTTYAGSSAYTPGSTSCRIKVDNGSFAFFKPGTVHDIYQGNTIKFSGAVATDANPVDFSVGLARFSSSSTANFDNVADNNSLYYSASKDQGMYSVESWFSTPTSGESFIGGVDRTSANWRYLIPTTYDAGTARQIQVTDFDLLAKSMQYQIEGEHPVIAKATLEITQKLRQLLGNEAFIPWTQVGTEMQKRYASFGNIGLNYQHPAFGMIVITADPFAPPNKVEFIRSDTWLDLQYGRKGLKFMEGGDIGIWKRQPSTVPGNGYSMIYRCEAYANHCTFCLYPWKNGQIINVTG